jgi:hypothetical protein
MQRGAAFDTVVPLVGACDATEGDDREPCQAVAPVTESITPSLPISEPL